MCRQYSHGKTRLAYFPGSRPVSLVLFRAEFHEISLYEIADLSVKNVVNI